MSLAHPCAGGTGKAISCCPLLQGGVSDELSLSAYVTAALLELGVSPTVRTTPGGEQVLGQGTSPAPRSGCVRPHRSGPDLGVTGLTGQRSQPGCGNVRAPGLAPDSARCPPFPRQEPTVSLALQCLEASSTDDLYTQALLAYVCGLAGRNEQHQARLQSLVQRGVSTGTSCTTPRHAGPPCPSLGASLNYHPSLPQRGCSSGRGKGRLCPRSPSGLRPPRQRWR